MIFWCHLRLLKLEMVREGHHTAILQSERLDEVFFVFTCLTVGLERPALDYFEHCRLSQ